MSCRSFDDLLAWIAAGRPGDGPLGTHGPDHCPDCRRRLSLLGEMTSTMGQPAPATVPLALRQRVLADLAAASAPSAAPTTDAPPSRLSRMLDRIQEFVAEVIDPTAAPGLAAGLRGEQDGDVQSYQVGPYTLDLGLVDRRALMGQVTDEEDREVTELAGAECILCGADGVQQAQLGDDGGFRFDDAGPGRYALMIEASGVRLVFPDVDMTEV